MTEPDDAAAAKSGGVGFEEFVAASSRRLFTMARLLTGGQDAEAEDLLQGVFERAYRRWGWISGRSDPERYIRQMLLNASVDRWRWRRRHPEVSLDYPGIVPSVGDVTAPVVERDFLVRCLGALPPRQRAVLVLRYFEDLSEAQTAAMLGCSVAAVKKQAGRALARLREMTSPPTASESSVSEGNHTT